MYEGDGLTASFGAGEEGAHDEYVSDVSDGVEEVEQGDVFEAIAFSKLSLVCDD